MLMMLKKMQRKLHDRCGGDSNDWCWYAFGEVGHPAPNCPNTKQVAVTWSETTPAAEMMGCNQ